MSADDINDAMRENLLRLARAYKKMAKVKRMTQVSYKFYGRNSFLEQFAKKRCSISIDKYGEMVRKFYAEWPLGETLPELLPLDMHP